MDGRLGLAPRLAHLTLAVRIRLRGRGRVVQPAVTVVGEFAVVALVLLLLAMVVVAADVVVVLMVIVVGGGEFEEFVLGHGHGGLVSGMLLFILVIVVVLERGDRLGFERVDVTLMTALLLAHRLRVRL